jgi:aspartyl-tRNA(Asn)/glutamyl-tRNA(Gln) amidotransferase subunit A
VSDIPDTLAEAATALRAGSVSSVDLTKASIDRADRLDEKLGTYLCRADDEALQAAAEADAELSAGNDRGPLHGIPVGVKDIVATAGLPTTAQSLVLDPAWGEHGDASVVARLRAAGAVVTGKTTTLEFAIGLPDRTKPFPIPRNPWALDRWAGGSSSGTANGIAAGLFWAGIGTDTGGSIRMPSALCGITGLKPTFGRVPRSGVVPLSWSFDHVGPMARTARDCALMLDVLAGHDPSDPLSADVATDEYAAALNGSVAGLRIGVLRRHHVDAPFVDPSAIAAFESALVALGTGGALVEEIDVPAWDILNEACLPIFMAEALAYHRRDLAERWDDYGSFTRQMITSALFYTAVDHVQAQRVRHFVGSEVERVLSTFDIIATPTAGAGAPPVDTLDFVSALTLPVFTAAWNALGLPAISVPCGFTEDGLPVGLQLAGRRFDEVTVLRAADGYQALTDWHTRRPSSAEHVAR